MYIYIYIYAHTLTHTYLSVSHNTDISPHMNIPGTAANMCLETESDLQILYAPALAMDSECKALLHPRRCISHCTRIDKAFNTCERVMPRGMNEKLFPHLRCCISQDTRCAYE